MSSLLLRPPLLQGPRSLILAKLPLNGSGLRSLLNRSEDTRVLRYQDAPRHLHPRHGQYARLRHGRARRGLSLIRLLTRL
jgi:hypothetical protein